uniref:EF-hand domain-containing protein n=1 Tax=Eutreptiella gymnastica TaxID=73025 RepID=A0A7S4G5W4_9EUGL
MASALALARSKRHNTGFKSNSDAFRSGGDGFEQTQPPILLVQQTMGNKDPIMRENNWRGPAPMSTTNKVAYASHKTTDVDCLEDAEIDFGHRPPMNGSVTNRVTTVHNVPHDGWRPVTEMKAKYGNHSTGVADFELASRHGVREPGQNDIPPPVAAHGLKPMGLPAVDLVRLTLYDIYGRRGMRALTRTLKDMLGPDGNMKLDKNALVTALQHLGLDPTPQEVDELMHFFDRDRSGIIEPRELLAGIRGLTVDARRKLVRQAFKQLDPEGTGSVLMSEMLQLYDPNHHPEVLRGAASPEDVYQEFAEDWSHKRPTDPVTLGEFCEYYDDVSTMTDDDDYFELLLRNTWHVSGGKGVAACTACRRVFVEHTDGRQSVETLKNDLRIQPHEMEKMRQNLITQGISDIVEINLLDGGNTTEPGDLQRAVFENRNVHAAQASRGNWVPFRNSTQSSYDLMGGNTCGNAIKDLYPHRLCASKERKMAREDPVEFQVYTSQDPMETTSGASMAPRRNQYHTSVDEVLQTNPLALKAAQNAPDLMTRSRVLTGQPNREMNDGGYARNNGAAVVNEWETCQNPHRLHLKEAPKARVAKRLEYEGQKNMSIYKSEFRDQHKVPVSAQNFCELKKNLTGFSYQNQWHVMPPSEADLEMKRMQQTKPQLQKTGIPIVDAVRQRIFDRAGAGGFRALTRILRVMDDDGNRNLTPTEFHGGLQAYGISLTPQEMDQVLRVFDRDGSGTISITEFIRQLRGPMPERRQQLIRMAYQVLDRNSDERVTMRELLGIYDCSGHPDVVAQRKTPEQVMQDFSASWDKNNDAIITLPEFTDYYADISAGIDDDRYFELMMKNCWRLSVATPKTGTPKTPKFSRF